MIIWCMLRFLDAPIDSILWVEIIIKLLETGIVI